MNQVYLLGNIGADAEIHRSQSGMAIINLSIATGEKKNDQWVSTWHKIVVFGDKAEEMVPRLKKGVQVFVQGKITNREYEKDGIKHRVTEILPYKIEIIDKGEKRNVDDGIPF